MVVLGGNMRYRAAQELKYKEVPVIVMEGLDEAGEKAIIIKDNGNFGEWDFEMLANEWSDFPLKEWGIDLPETSMRADSDEVKEDDFDADAEADAIEEPRTKRGDVWKIGRHRIMCGDATSIDDLTKLMDGQKADLCWTDPPYGVSYTDKNDYLNNKRAGNKHKAIAGDELRGDALYEMLQAAFANVSAVSHPGACIYVAHADINSALFRLALTEADYHISQSLIWVNNCFVLSRNDYNWQHEPILYGWKQGHAHFFSQDFTSSTVIDDQPDLKKMSKEELVVLAAELRKTIPTTVFKENRPSKNEEHPTMKPVALIARMVRNSSDHTKPQIVLDTFMGSGSTLIACEQIGRTAYGMELDPVYCDVIVKRYETFTGETATLVPEEANERQKTKTHEY
jgi:DNA modification methylase